VVTARGSDEVNAKRRAEEIDIIHEIENETLLVKDSGTKLGIAGNYSIDYAVTVPQKFGVKIQTMSGDIAVRLIDGEINIINYSGDIHCRDCSKSIKANTKSGDVGIECITGDVNLRTLSGDLTLSDIVSGSVSCNTLSGDIEAKLNPVAEADIDLQTLSGDIELKIDPTANLAISAETLSGELSCSLPVIEIEKKARRFKAVLNEDSGNLNLKTKSGDITLGSLEKRGEDAQTESRED